MGCCDNYCSHAKLMLTYYDGLASQLQLLRPGVDSDSGCRLVQGRLPTMLDGGMYHLGKSVDLRRGDVV